MAARLPRHHEMIAMSGIDRLFVRSTLLWDGLVSPEFQKFALQIGSSPLDEAFELGHAAVETLGRTRPLASVQ